MTVQAIPTTYHGITFKSRFESNVAFLLDLLGYTWSYEPQSFLLDNGLHYWPDFWLPGPRFWIESRGYIGEKGEAQVQGFRAAQSTPRPTQR